jgi:hypothetical protein
LLVKQAKNSQWEIRESVLKIVSRCVTEFHPLPAMFVEFAVSMAHVDGSSEPSPDVNIA